MSKNFASEVKQTESIPVMTMVDVPLLTEKERSEFIETLEKAEKDIAEGRGLTLSADGIGDWLALLSAEARMRRMPNV